MHSKGTVHQLQYCICERDMAATLTSGRPVVIDECLDGGVN